MNARTLILTLVLLFASPLALADELGPGEPTQNMTASDSGPGDVTTNDELGPGNTVDGEQDVLPWWWRFLFPGVKI